MEHAGNLGLRGSWLWSSETAKPAAIGACHTQMLGSQGLFHCSTSLRAGLWGVCHRALRFPQKSTVANGVHYMGLTWYWAHPAEENQVLVLFLELLTNKMLKQVRNKHNRTPMWEDKGKWDGDEGKPIWSQRISMSKGEGAKVSNCESLESPSIQKDGIS